MNKIFTLRCPKENDRQYFSLEKHRYKNNLTVMINDEVVFENINDAEENLPIVMNEQILFDSNSVNTVDLIYNISFGDVKEKTDVSFVFDSNSSICTTYFNRKNFVEGSEKLSNEYLIKLKINNQTHAFDKTFHEGETKNISVQTYVDMDLPITVSLESKKQFLDSDDITYDQLEFEIQ
jgi:hypothetical protein